MKSHRMMLFFCVSLVYPLLATEDRDKVFRIRLFGFEFPVQTTKPRASGSGRDVKLEKLEDLRSKIIKQINAERHPETTSTHCNGYCNDVRGMNDELFKANLPDFFSKSEQSKIAEKYPNNEQFKPVEMTKDGWSPQSIARDNSIAYFRVPLDLDKKYIADLSNEQKTLLLPSYEPSGRGKFSPNGRIFVLGDSVYTVDFEKGILSRNRSYKNSDRCPICVFNTGLLVVKNKALLEQSFDNNQTKDHVHQANVGHAKKCQVVNDSTIAILTLEPHPDSTTARDIKIFKKKENKWQFSGLIPLKNKFYKSFEMAGAKDTLVVRNRWYGRISLYDLSSNQPQLKAEKKIRSNSFAISPDSAFLAVGTNKIRSSVDIYETKSLEKRVEISVGEDTPITRLHWQKYNPAMIIAADGRNWRYNVYPYAAMFLATKSKP